MCTVETSLRLEAFEYYYSLGENRSIEAVAEKFGKSPRTVKGWSSKGAWDERVSQRNIELGDNTTVVSVKAGYRVIINQMIEKAIDKVIAGEIKIESVEDLERLVKLELLLIGESNSIKENAGTVIELPEVFRDLLDAKIKELSQKKET